MGNGTCELIQETSNLRSVVVRQIERYIEIDCSHSRALQPSLTSVMLESTSSIIRQAPTKLPPIWNKQRYLVLIIINYLPNRFIVSYMIVIFKWN